MAFVVSVYFRLYDVCSVCVFHAMAFVVSVCSRLYGVCSVCVFHAMAFVVSVCSRLYDVCSGCKMQLHSCALCFVRVSINYYYYY